MIIEVDDITFLALIVKPIVIVISYGYAAISDWIKREVNPLIWLLPIAIGIPINIFIMQHIIYIETSPYTEILRLHIFSSIVTSIVLIAVISVLSFIFNLIGGADVLALIAFTSIYPSNIEALYTVLKKHELTYSLITLALFLSPLIIVLVLCLLMNILYVILNIVNNVRYINKIRELQIPLHKKLAYIILGRITRVKDILNKRFYYPMYVPNVVERLIFRIDEDDQAWISKLRELEPETIIVVSWGIPMVSFLAISTYIYIGYYVTLLFL